LTKPNIDIAVDLFQTPPQQLDTIHGFFDPSGQLSHLGLEPIHADLDVNRSAGACPRWRRAGTTVDLSLQHAEVSLEAIQTVLHCTILGSRRLDRRRNRNKQQ
jgi:hypothetical protein